jgi:hypothetical protein
MLGVNFSVRRNHGFGA